MAAQPFWKAVRPGEEHGFCPFCRALVVFRLNRGSAVLIQLKPGYETDSLNGCPPEGHRRLRVNMPRGKDIARQVAKLLAQGPSDDSRWDSVLDKVPELRVLLAETPELRAKLRAQLERLSPQLGYDDPDFKPSRSRGRRPFITPRPPKRYPGDRDLSLEKQFEERGALSRQELEDIVERYTTRRSGQQGWEPRGRYELAEGSHKIVCYKCDDVLEIEGSRET